MTFTYSGTASGTALTALHKTRLEIGDTDSTAALFTDEELDVYLDARSDSVLLAAADACDVLATRFARAYDFSTDGQSFSRSKMTEMYRQRAKDLRTRASGVVTVATTRVDGYSSTVKSDETSASTDENVRQTYYVIGGADVAP